MVLMNVVYSLSAYPAGILSDRLDRPTMLITGLLVLVAADVILGFSTTLGGVGLGVVLWGLHMGLTQGLLSTLVADAAPAELRGTAFGLFNLLTGTATLVASVVAGGLWDWGGYRATFVAGAVFAGIAVLGMFLIRARLRPKATRNGR